MPARKYQRPEFLLELHSQDDYEKWLKNKSKEGGRAYKKEFALLPTIDHVKELGVANFEICSWQTNDAKNDLSIDEFKALCKKVLEHNQ